MKYRLAVLMTHAICYHGPLFRRLNEDPEIDVTVFYCCPDFGLTEGWDAELRRHYKWNIPVLEGYRFKILRNYAPRTDQWGSFSFVNPGIVWELMRGRFDAVMIHGYRVATEWLALLGARLTRTPVLFRGETGFRPVQTRGRERMKRFVLGWLIHCRGTFLAVSGSSRRFYKHYGIASDRVFWTPYSVDNDFFTKSAAEWWPRRDDVKRRLGVPLDLPVILQTSKLMPRKRPFDLLEAHRRLGGRTALVFVGDGELRRPLEAHVKACAIPNVFFAGFQNQGDISAYYSIGDIFVLPSTHDIFGIAVNEAMCFRLPVIASDTVGSAADLVRPGENGLIYPAGDVDALTEALQALVDDPERRRRMGETSLRLISEWNYDRCVLGVREALRASPRTPRPSP